MHNFTGVNNKMHGKLILTLDGEVINEYSIKEESLTIGRKHGNEIQLNDLTISGRHALIIAQGKQVYIEDLGSTNGTLLNGNHIKSAILKQGDVIQAGHHQFTYLRENQAKYEATMFVKAEMDETQMVLPEWQSLEQGITGQPLAGLRTLNGPLARTVMELRKPFNTIGFQGKKLALISRSQEGYNICAVPNGQGRLNTATPLLNGEPLCPTPQNLKASDIINIAGFEVEFFLIN